MKANGTQSLIQRKIYASLKETGYQYNRHGVQ